MIDEHGEEEDEKTKRDLGIWKKYHEKDTKSVKIYNSHWRLSSTNPFIFCVIIWKHAWYIIINFVQNLSEVVKEKEYFEKNLDDQLKGADRVHFLYLYYLIYINAVHEDIFYGLLNDGCDGSYAKLFRRDEQNNPLALQVFKYNILGFKKIEGLKNE